MIIRLLAFCNYLTCWKSQKMPHPPQLHKYLQAGESTAALRSTKAYGASLCKILAWAFDKRLVVKCYLCSQ